MPELFLKRPSGQLSSSTPAKVRSGVSRLDRSLVKVDDYFSLYHFINESFCENLSQYNIFLRVYVSVLRTNSSALKLYLLLKKTPNPTPAYFDAQVSSYILLNARCG
jgi:hypothetical protein